MPNATFRQTQTPPRRQWWAAECECNYKDCQTVSCPASAPLLRTVFTAIICRLSLNCAFHVNHPDIVAKKHAEH